MKEIISNAPINIASVNLTTPGKLLPIQVAALLSEVSQNRVKATISWNTGASLEHNDLIEPALRRYNLNEIRASYDDLPAFHDWGRSALAYAISKGTIQISQEQVIACSGCGAALVLAAAGIAPNKCGGCGAEGKTHQDQTRVMCADATCWPEELQTATAVINAPSNWAGQLAYFSDKIMISKPRTKGLSLDQFGLVGAFLDPRVTNALFVAYEAETSKVDNGWSVLAAENLFKVAPYMYGFRYNPMPQTGFIGISKMPVDSLLKEEALTKEFAHSTILKTIAGLSLDGKTWINNPVRVQEIRGLVQRHRIEKIFSQSADEITRQNSSSTYKATVVELCKAVPATIKGIKLRP